SSHGILMRLTIFVLLTCLTGTPVVAQDLSPDEATVLPRILSVVDVDLIGDRAGNERAVLLRSSRAEDYMADLVILSGETDSSKGEVLLTARGLVWAGTAGGQVPWLELSLQGGLLVKSEQVGIGNTP